MEVGGGVLRRRRSRSASKGIRRSRARHGAFGPMVATTARWSEPEIATSSTDATARSRDTSTWSINANGGRRQAAADGPRGRPPPSGRQVCIGEAGLEQLPQGLVLAGGVEVAGKDHRAVHVTDGLSQLLELGIEVPGAGEGLGRVHRDHGRRSSRQVDGGMGHRGSADLQHPRVAERVSAVDPGAVGAGAGILDEVWVAVGDAGRVQGTPIGLGELEDVEHVGVEGEDIGSHLVEAAMVRAGVRGRHDGGRPARRGDGVRVVADSGDSLLFHAATPTTCTARPRKALADRPSTTRSSRWTPRPNPRRGGLRCPPSAT
jgi:hypothetical protein